MKTKLLPLNKWLYWGMGLFDCSSILVLPSSLKYDWGDEPKATNRHVPFWDLPQNPNSSSLLSQEKCKHPKHSDMDDIRPWHSQWKRIPEAPDTGAENKRHTATPYFMSEHTQYLTMQNFCFGCLKVTGHNNSGQQKIFSWGGGEEKGIESPPIKDTMKRHALRKPITFSLH